MMEFKVFQLGHYEDAYKKPVSKPRIDQHLC